MDTLPMPLVPFVALIAAFIGIVYGLSVFALGLYRLTNDQQIALLTPWRWLRCHLSLPFYFWLPCPNCGHAFGGWEWKHSVGNRGVCNRTACVVAARRYAAAEARYWRTHPYACIDTTTGAISYMPAPTVSDVMDRL